MEADICKQQLGWLMMESKGSRSLSRVITDPDAHLGSVLFWEGRGS